MTRTEKRYTEAQSEYLQSNPTWHVEDSPWKARQILKMIQKNGLIPESIVEVGCGAGEILNQLHKLLPQRTQFTGFDISEDAILLAQQRSGTNIRFHHGNILNDKTTFDLLLMIDVFEHVDDYLGFLRACKGKSTYSIFHIPLDITLHGIFRNTMIGARKSVGHLHYFTKETAIATLEDSGYEILDFFYTAGGIELPLKTIRSGIAAAPRRFLSFFSKGFTAKALGGFSLMVLTK